MILDRAELEKHENEWCRKSPIDFRQNRALFEGMYQEAVKLGVLPDDNPLEGIDVDIRIARILNSVSKSA